MLIDRVSALFPSVSALLCMLPVQAGQEAMMARSAWKVALASCVCLVGQGFSAPVCQLPETARSEEPRLNVNLSAHL